MRISSSKGTVKGMSLLKTILGLVWWSSTYFVQSFFYFEYNEMMFRRSDDIIKNGCLNFTRYYSTSKVKGNCDETRLCILWVIFSQFDSKWYAAIYLLFCIFLICACHFWLDAGKTFLLHFASYISTVKYNHELILFRALQCWLM